MARSEGSWVTSPPPHAGITVIISYPDLTHAFNALKCEISLPPHRGRSGYQISIVNPFILERKVPKHQGIRVFSRLEGGRCLFSLQNDVFNAISK